MFSTSGCTITSMRVTKYFLNMTDPVDLSLVYVRPEQVIPATGSLEDH